MDFSIFLFFVHFFIFLYLFLGVLVKGQSPQQELEVGPLSGPYLLV